MTYFVDELAHALAHGVRLIALVCGGGQMQVEFLAGEGDGVAVEEGEVCGCLEFYFAVVRGVHVLFLCKGVKRDQ